MRGLFTKAYNSIKGVFCCPSEKHSIIVYDAKIFFRKTSNFLSFMEGLSKRQDFKNLKMTIRSFRFTQLYKSCFYLRLYGTYKLNLVYWPTDNQGCTMAVKGGPQNRALFDRKLKIVRIGRFWRFKCWLDAENMRNCMSCQQ